MKTVFEIKGQVKSGKNNMGITRSGKHYPLKKWAEWRDIVVMSMRDQMVRQNFKSPYSCRCLLVVKYWRGDDRRRDVPGMMDALFHCLERANVVKDDSLLEHIEWYPMGLDRENPRVILEIEPYLRSL